jgi:alkylation response protein AidB-like acyl-CoA dehydrogenase
MDAAASSETILAAARELVPTVSARAEEIAAQRRLPLDLVTQLKRAGVFRMPMPRAWGGPEMSPRAQTEVVELLSAADPAVGWCVMIGSDAGFFAAFLDEAPARKLYPDLDAVTAGMLQPAGRAERVPGGYRVSGRWAFGSGCTHADVMIGGCLVMDGGAPVLDARGRPSWRVMLAPASSWTVLDTWYTTGLAGSGSNDYTADGLFVPEEHTFSLLEKPRRSEPLYAFNGMFFANMHGVPLGLARRAIDCVAKLADEKMMIPDMVRMKDVPRVRSALARAEMQLGAARAYTYETLDAVWETLNERGELSRELRIALSLSRIHAFRVARDVTQAMVDTAGASAIYATSPLDRLMRDAITMSQHVVAQERLVEMIGALLVGEEAPIPFL